MCPDPAQSSQISVLYTGTQAPTIDNPRLRILHRPMLQARPVDFDPTSLRALICRAKTLVFYSPNSVEILADSDVFSGLNLSDKTFWAVGQKTAEAVEASFGIQAIFPADQQFAGMLSQFSANPPRLPLVAFGLEDSPRTLIGEAPGQFEPDNAANIHEISVYQTVPQRYPKLGNFLQKTAIQWIAFGSPRAVSTLLSQVEPADLKRIRFAAIGPTTADAIRRHRLIVDLCMTTPDRDLMMLEILKSTPAP